MACKNVCRLCDKLIISTGVFNIAGALTITIPEGNYEDGEKYCLVIAQTIPDTLTIGAAVNVRIGAGTTDFPVIRKDCTPLTACGLRTRTKYSTKVVTTSTGGSFRLLGDPCCQPNNNLVSINGDT